MSYREKQNTSQSRAINREEFPWIIRAKERAKLVSDYMKQFKNISTIYADSVKENYYFQLERYVSEVANIQAQMIISDPSGVGWNSMIVFGHHNSESERNQFFHTQRQQAENGEINVAIPTNRLMEIKEFSEYLMNIYNSRQKVKTIPAEEVMIKTSLDLEIDRQIMAKFAP